MQDLVLGTPCIKSRKIRDTVPRYNAVEAERDEAQRRLAAALREIDSALCLMVEGPDAAPGEWHKPAVAAVARAVGILNGSVKS